MKTKNTGYGRMELITCPECKGFGNTFTNSLKDRECICKGVGEVWYNRGNGFGVPKGKRLENHWFRY